MGGLPKAMVMVMVMVMVMSRGWQKDADGYQGSTCCEAGRQSDLEASLLFRHGLPHIWGYLEG